MYKMFSIFFAGVLLVSQFTQSFAECLCCGAEGDCITEQKNDCCTHQSPESGVHFAQDDIGHGNHLLGSNSSTCHCETKIGTHHDEVSMSTEHRSTWVHIHYYKTDCLCTLFEHADKQLVLIPSPFPRFSSLSFSTYRIPLLT